MSHYIEQKAERVACDLSQGQVCDAANVLRTEVERNPQAALQLIQMANQMRDQCSPDHIVVQNGNVFIRDEYHRTQTYAGHLDFDRNYGRNEDCDPRYGRGYYDRDRYDQGRYDQDRYNRGRYDRDCDDRDRYDRDRYDRDRYDQGRYNRAPYDRDCDQAPIYGNPYPYRPECPPVYRQPDCYPRQQIYIPDCYGNGERRGLNVGTAALLVLGGVALSRSISQGGGQFTIRERW